MATRKPAPRTATVPRKKTGAKAPASPQAARIVASLAARSSDLRREGLELAIDFVLDEPLASFIDPPTITGWVVDAISPGNVARAVDQHARPAWKRHLARSRKELRPPGQWLSKDSRKALEGLVVKHPGPRAAWANGAVDPRLIGQLLAPVLEELLLSFTRRLPVLGGAAGGSGGRAVLGLGQALRKTVEKRAGQLVDAGRFVLGSVGVDVEAQIRAAASQMSQAATDELREAFVARVKSKEGRSIMGKVRLEVLERVLATPMVELSETVEPIPWAELERLAGAIANQARVSDAFVGLVREELGAALAVVGDRTVRELLEEAGLLQRVRADLLERLDPIGRRFFAAPAFTHWLDALLAQ